MTLLTAFEDFVNQTLAALPSLILKLEFVCGIRREDGSYEHWGLTRTYGNEQAQQAIAQAHTGLVVDLLTTPLQELSGELSRGGEDEGNALKQLRAQRASAFPADMGGCVPRHLNLTLEVLSVLARSRVEGIRPTA